MTTFYKEKLVNDSQFPDAETQAHRREVICLRSQEWSLVQLEFECVSLCDSKGYVLTTPGQLLYWMLYLHASTIGLGKKQMRPGVNVGVFMAKPIDSLHDIYWGFFYHEEALEIICQSMRNLKMKKDTIWISSSFQSSQWKQISKQTLITQTDRSYEVEV